MTLFFKECKKVIFSLTFLIYAAVSLFMYQSQYNSDRQPLQKPLPDLESYGIIPCEIPEILMPNAAESLAGEYVTGSYIAYPVGFYKNVRLSEKKKERMGEIIFEITGLTEEELEKYADRVSDGIELAVDSSGNMKVVQKQGDISEITIREEITYERFRELMREADKLIGGGSKYSDDYIVGNFSNVPQTYENALAEYEYMFSEEKISPAYARLFCDYMGITLSILPVFAAAALCDKDKRSNMCGLINSRRISSARLIMTRYMALVTSMLIPAALMTADAAFGVARMYPDSPTDTAAFFKLAAVWIIPCILISTAVGMLLTEAVSPLLAVFAQSAWWFADVMASAGGLTGNIGRFTLVPRHNNLYKAAVFRGELDRFLFNRAFYTGLSVVLVILTAMIYEIKRKGGYNGLFIGIKARKV
ncbi:MAG: ABC transporter permease [Ruminococcus sp.]|nr:ABC transporter permease [Ruminococcus sp.]